MAKRIIIATRKSPLALCQSEWIKSRLLHLNPSLQVEFLGLTTEGDKRLDLTLDKIGGKGLFVKELEEALVTRRADIAVHSMKDVPMALPPGLMLPVILEREDPRDVLVSPHFSSLMGLPNKATIGTSSVRRQTQLHHLRPDCKMRMLRGNVHTRLRRLDAGDFDAIVLAAAGLHRLNIHSRIREYFATETFLPAAGQGALGIECREDDTAIVELLMPLNDVESASCVNAERAVCQKLEGGCSVPIAAYASIHRGVLHLRALIASQDGKQILFTEQNGDPCHATTIGQAVAEALLLKGAEKMLRSFRE